MKNVNTIAGFGFFLIGFLLATNVIPLSSYWNGQPYDVKSDGLILINNKDVPQYLYSTIPTTPPYDSFALNVLFIPLTNPNNIKKVFVTLRMDNQVMGNNTLALNWNYSSSPPSPYYSGGALSYSTYPCGSACNITIKIIQLDFYIVSSTLGTIHKQTVVIQHTSTGWIFQSAQTYWGVGFRSQISDVLKYHSTTSSSSTTSNSQTRSSTSQSTTQSNPKPFSLSLNQTLGFASMLVGVLLIYRGRRSM